MKLFFTCAGNKSLKQNGGLEQFKSYISHRNTWKLSTDFVRVTKIIQIFIKISN